MAFFYTVGIERCVEKRVGLTETQTASQQASKTDRQTGRQADRQTDRPTFKRTDAHTCTISRILTYTHTNIDLYTDTI